MKTNRILLGLATLTLLSCHRIPVIKSTPCCAKDGAATTTTTPQQAPGNNSVYQLAGSWTDQHEKQLTLSKLQGHPQIVAMIFTHCASVCPRIVEEMKAIRDSLPIPVRKQVGGVLVSFDPDRDTPAQMKSYAAQRQLDDHWELLRGSDDQVRELSMVLNVKYQKLSGGNISHTGNIYILDRDGNIVQSVDGLGGNVHSAVSALERLASK
jgi:protein SCO1/2